ncbi:purine nucleoside phosphorylase-like [Saccoglossus kowalevskii]|uniref:purine-nucleoside phosphorylase n=1 Tax=Saccoglossus kowalevskii TaxID=10224 RepID=A0ABM0M3M8_SACKO|nr:PREDICTED: purine nucleoside phosphorylase-like [Saccoglossus kowalevskii]
MDVQAAGRYIYEEIEAIKTELESKTIYRPKVGIVLADGFESLTSIIRNQETVSYADIPTFPISKSHESHLIFGDIGGKTIVCSKGNVTQMEGFPAWQVAIPVRVMSFMGAETLIIINKVQKLNDKYKAGDIVLIKDHINLPGLAGDSPLVGINDPRLGPRFFGISGVYDNCLRRLCRHIGSELDIDSIKEGIYVQASGPSFESNSEFTFLKMVGADMLGMNMLPEIVIAKACGMRVCAIALVTDGQESGHPGNLILDHDVDLDSVALRSEGGFRSLLSRLVSRIDEEIP